MKYLLALVALLVPVLAPAQTLLSPSKVAVPLSSQPHIYLLQKHILLGSQKDTLSGCASSFTMVEEGQFIIASTDEDKCWVRIANTLLTPSGSKPIIAGAGLESPFYTWRDTLDLISYELVTERRKYKRVKRNAH